MAAYTTVLLQENNIDITESIGIEHLIIGKTMSTVQLALRESVSELLLEEQRRQKELGCWDVDELARVVLPFSQISSSIAMMKAEAY